MLPSSWDLTPCSLRGIPTGRAAGCTRTLPLPHHLTPPSPGSAPPAHEGFQLKRPSHCFLRPRPCTGGVPLPGTCLPQILTCSVPSHPSGLSSDVSLQASPRQPYLDERLPHALCTSASRDLVYPVHLCTSGSSPARAHRSSSVINTDDSCMRGVQAQANQGPSHTLLSGCLQGGDSSRGSLTAQSEGQCTRATDTAHGNWLQRQGEGAPAAFPKCRFLVLCAHQSLSSMFYGGPSARLPSFPKWVLQPPQ